MKKIILLALAAIIFAGCAKNQNNMENQAIQNIMTRVSVRDFTGEKISKAQIDTFCGRLWLLLLPSTNSLGHLS